MYCIGVLRVSIVFYWSGHVLYMCVKGIDCFLLERSCTVYVF